MQNSRLVEQRFPDHLVRQRRKREQPRNKWDAELDWQVSQDDRGKAGDCGQRKRHQKAIDLVLDQARDKLKNRRRQNRQDRYKRVRQFGR